MKHSAVSAGAVPAWSIFPELEPPTAPVPEKRFGRSSKGNEIRIEPRVLAAPRGHIRTNILSFSNMSDYGDLLVSYLKARHAVFIDRLHWTLPETEGMEFDQYDTPQCRWAIIHEYGEILGGVRLVPTTARCGIYSYMLRDAQRGLLENIPNDVLFFEAPVEERVWEASRLFIAETVPAQRRQVVQDVLMEQMSVAARAVGATSVIGIVPAVWSRWLRRLGLGAVPVGPKFEIDGTASQAALFNVAQKYVN